MGGGNGQKSATARARKQAEAAQGVAKSQLKANEDAKIACSNCKQSLLKTANKMIILQHVQKHSSKTGNEIEAEIPIYFPTWVESVSKSKQLKEQKKK